MVEALWLNDCEAETLGVGSGLRLPDCVAEALRLCCWLVLARRLALPEGVALGSLEVVGETERERVGVLEADKLCVRVRVRVGRAEAEVARLSRVLGVG